MSFITQIDCFKGFYQIARNCYGYERLQAYIDKYEYYYLCKLLGQELYDNLIADLVDGVPQNPDYLEWYNPFCEEVENSCCCNYECGDELFSNGLKNMVTGFVYYQFVHFSQMRQTPTGTTVSNTNNSSKVGMINNERDAEQRYNDSVEFFNSISHKLGKCKKLSYKFLDLI